jgi:MFS family permease
MAAAAAPRMTGFGPTLERRGARQAPVYAGRGTRPGLFFAVAAVTVTAPRLALAFLAADGVLVPTPWRIDLLAISSVATAVVLTGGMAYLAQAIAVARSQRGVLILLWAAALACSGALIAPSIVATLRMQPLSAVLGLERHWSWSICAVLAVDLVASGAMLADAWRLAADPPAHPVGQPGADPLFSVDDPLEGVDSPTLTPRADLLLHPCPWGCGRRFITKDAANGHGRHCPALAAKKAVAIEGAAGRSGAQSTVESLAETIR